MFGRARVYVSRTLVCERAKYTRTRTVQWHTAATAADDRRHATRVCVACEIMRVGISREYAVCGFAEFCDHAGACNRQIRVRVISRD